MSRPSYLVFRAAFRSAVVLAAAMLSALPSQAQSYVVGYWQNINSLSQTQITQLTHLVYAFATLDTTNTTCDIPYPPAQSTLKQFKTWNPNLKILVSIGGESSGADYTTLAGNATTFAQ